MSSASCGCKSLSVAICFLGITSRWTGALGLMSWMAMYVASSYAIFAGICRAMILEKMVSAIEQKLSLARRGLSTHERAGHVERHHFDQHLSFARPVELAEVNALPCPQHELPLFDQ